MPISSSLIAAILPMTFYLVIIWKMDKNEREPLAMLFLHFMWGAFGAIILGLIGSIFLNLFLSVHFFNESQNGLIQTIIFAPLSEEIAKGVFLLWTVNSRRFDNLTDGIVYGSAIGLGFGMTENFTYFLSFGDTFESWLYLVIVRSLFSAVMHCIATATFGAFLAIYKFSKHPIRNILPFSGMLLAMLIHLLWNASVSIDGNYFYGLLFMILLIIIFIMTIKLSVNYENVIIRNELAEESRLGILPQNHVLLLASNLRFRKGWIDESIRSKYINAAIKLAFRKYQYRNSSKKNESYYEEQINLYRNTIPKILSNELV
jgi:RsiW-degrading membrane proteinase PrsW (M82 family)